MAGDRAMVATYRLQLGPEMTFDDVRSLVPYFRDLGVSHLYLSPMLQAREGSTHGYDVTDPSAVSRELGGEDAFRALAAAGLGIVVDIVPNHMGTADENAFWSDPELREKFFDVDPETGKWRRFFDIDDLAAVKVEDEEVFRATHEKTLALLREGLVDGVRVDHPDGLADPAQYLRRLREAGAGHVWVEKILHPGEPLRDWPVDGTVGYEFLVDVASLYVDPAGEEPITALWEELAGDPRPFAAWAREAQLEQAASPFDRELDRLRRVWPEGPDDLRLDEAIADIPVYRTYVEPGTGQVDDEDRRALARLPEQLQRILLLETQGVPAEWVTRFQQTSPAITAKGIEDTAFYRYVRLLAHNDVGNDPGRWNVSVADFHADNAARAERSPRNLLITSTHDTKRSGDVRARIGALSEVPGQWAAFARRWAGDAEEYFVLQTLVGAWPIGDDRLRPYLEKALRERKLTSNWIDPDTEHEAAVQDFAAGLVASEEFRAALDELLAEVRPRGERAALGQVLLKLTVPGVPDVYQGDELEALSLVDPDNRRPVDWDARRAALERLAGDAAPDGFGERKLDLIRRGLALRARHGGADGLDGYWPLEAGAGTVAFARSSGVIAVAEVRPDDGAAVAVPEDLQGTWRDVLGDRDVTLGERVEVAALVTGDGLALLERA